MRTTLTSLERVGGQIRAIRDGAPQGHLGEILMRWVNSRKRLGHVIQAKALRTLNFSNTQTFHRVMRAGARILLIHHGHV